MASAASLVMQPPPQFSKSEISKETPLLLPKLEFSGSEILLHGSDEWCYLRAQVREALETFGCFEVVHKEVPKDLDTSFFHALEDLFALPEKIRSGNAANKPYDGYIGYNPLHPLFEGMRIEEAEQIEKVEKFTSTMWPERNQNFSKNVCTFVKHAKELDQTIKRMVFESFGVGQYYESHINATNYHLSLIKYRTPSPNETKVGLGAHTDNGILTILYQSKDGLYCQAKNGQWFPVKVAPGSFIVMAADCLWACTNGRVHSAPHSVMIDGNEERYSAGLFTTLKPGHLVQAPKELVDEEHPMLLKPFDHGEFTKIFGSKLHIGGKEALMTYFGAQD